MKRKNTSGISAKVTRGFVFIALILFFSGALSVFELVRMNDFVSRRINDNVRCVELSSALYAVQSEYNSRILTSMADDSLSAPDITYDDTFTEYLDEIFNSLLDKSQKNAADSVLYAYAAYMQVSREASKVWPEGTSARREWYFSRLKPVFERQNHYIEALSQATRKALEDNSGSMDDALYRSLMPSVISLLAAIILIFLFDLYLKYYFINPVLRINRGIRDFKQVHKPYSVKVVNDDEIAQLSSQVEELTESANGH